MGRQAEVQMRLRPAALAAMVVAIWAGTVVLRAPWFGRLSDGGLQLLTANSVKYARNWRDEGAWRLRFAMFEEPASPEFPTLQSREPYPTYPSGSIVPIWLLAELLGRDPTPALAMGWDLAVELGTALALAAVAWTLALPLGSGLALWLAAIPPAVLLLLPGPLYYFQCVYFADQMVLLPAALALLWEVRRSRNLKLYDALAAATFAWGLATDWLFLPLALVFGLWRVLQLPSPRRALPAARAVAPLWLPCAAVLMLFALQVQWLGQWPLLLARGAQRTQLTAASGGGETADFASLFWGRNVPAALGPLGVWLVALTMAALALLWIVAWRMKKLDRAALPLGAGAALSMAALLQIHLLAEHSSVHGFSALKLALVVALVTFCALPVALAQLLPARWAKLPLLAAPAAAALFVATAFPSWRALFPTPGVAGEDAAFFVAARAQPLDVVLSPSLQISPMQPALLALARKPVHRAGSAEEGLRDLRLSPGARLCVVAREGCRPAAYLAGAEQERDGRFVWLRLDADATARLALAPPTAPFCQ